MMRKVSLALTLTLFMASANGWTATLSDDFQDELVSQAEVFREEARRLPAKPEEKPEIKLEEKKEEGPGVDTGPVFDVRHIELMGNTVFKDKELEKFVKELESKAVTLEKLRQGAQAVTNHYRAKGFVTSRAYIPPQTLEDGRVEMKVVEGKIGKIFVEDNKYFSKSIYEKSIRLRSDRVFRYQDLETSLYFLNRKPDRKAKAFLIAGEDATTSDIILKVEDKKPVHAYYEFNNRGSKLTHRGRHSVHGIHNNISGRGDILHVSASAAEEAAFGAVSFSYTLPFDETNTDFNLTGTAVESLLVGPLKSFEIEGQTLSLTPTLTQTFIESPKFSFQVFAALELKDSKTLVGDFKSSFDRLRVLNVGPRLSWNDVLGRTTLTASVHQGLGAFFGGLHRNDVHASRPGSDDDFTYYTASVSRIHRLPKGFYLLGRANAQWADETMTSLEQFRLGGAYSVRGYQESDSGGDRGWNASIELGAPAHFVPKSMTVPFTKRKWRDALRIVGFIDGGKTYFRERTASTQVKDRFLVGAGFGFRLELDEYTSMQMDFGFPIGDTQNDREGLEAHVSMRSGF